MSQRYKGAIISATPPTTSTSSASGEWTLAQQMQAQGASAWPVANPDPYFNQVSLLLHGDGTNGAQNNTFLDSSTNNFTITRYGNTTQGTFSPFSQAAGYWSNYIPSAGSTYLSPGSSTSLALGSGDFTVELFVYVNAMGSYSTFLDWRSGGSYPANMPLLCDWNNNGKLCFIYGTGSSFVTVIESSITIPLKQWVHIAVVRSGTTVTMYFNGASVGSGTDSTNFGIQYLSIANQQATNFNADAYFSNVRLVKGTAVYTSNFTSPTSPLTAITNTSLLTCQSNRFVDNSSNNFTITPSGDTKVTAWSPFIPALTPYSTSTNGGSAYFDGNGDYLTVPSTDGFAFGTGDATVEFWSYPTAATGSGYIFDLRYIGNQLGLFYYNSSTTQYEWYFCGFNGGGTLGPNGLNTWTHWAIVRNSGTVTLYINGVSVTSGSGTASMGATGCSIGSRYSLDAPFYPGYISNLRFVKGTAVYTANFTPPTAPLTAISGTSLLLNCTNAAIYDNAIKNDVETVGNAQISTSVKKYGTGSMAFDGTGDSCAIADSPILRIGTEDFTIEAWIYKNNNSTQQSVVSKWSTNGWSLNFFNNSARLALMSNNSDLIVDTTNFPINQWVHVAVTRASTSLKMFVDGVLKNTVTNTSNFNSAYPLTVGALELPAAVPFNGYIDDLRITKGVARYTANFVPPIQAFPDY